MISLEGLTLTTGRHGEAGYILRTFAHYVRDGLIPNMFPEGEQRRPVSHGRCDAVVLPRDRPLSRASRATAPRCGYCCRSCMDIIEHHLHGTRFGIGVDPADGLLRQGSEGYQLTWMDAKVGDWVVTPRRGKAVEINALWYNALCAACGVAARRTRGRSRCACTRITRERARRSFNDGSGIAERGYLYDVVDGEQGDDPACRPNQIFAISLRIRCSTASAGSRCSTSSTQQSADAGRPAVAGAGSSRLQAEVLRRPAGPRRGVSPGNRLGLADRPVHRCLAEGASRRDRTGARDLLDGFDAAPRRSVHRLHQRDLRRRAAVHPRGCIAQAWSVAEVLRAG